jgi:predicted aldo/keto reductase-like oxidoreductase
MSVLAATDSSPSRLPERVLGKTKAKITALTLGTAPCGLTRPNSPKLVADCVNAALDQGITAVDTAPAYEVAEEGVGLALGNRRRGVFLSTKVMADTVADAERILSNSLRLLKTDYLDLVYFHNVGERNVEIALEAEGVLTWLLKQKQAGKLRFVGISGHNRLAKFVKLLESDQVDVLLTVVNFVDRHTYNFDEQILPLARKHNVGIVAMKVFGGARNMNYGDPKALPHLDPEYLELAVRHSLAVPGVTTLNLGAHNPEQIRQNIQWVTRAKPLSTEEHVKVASLGKQLAAKWGMHFGPVASNSHWVDTHA